MRHFLSHPIQDGGLSASSRPVRRTSTNVTITSVTTVRNLCQTLLLVSVALLSSSFAQVPFPTSRNDNSRTGANTSETLLTPANVNKNSFGHLFSTPVDYVVMAQPLFMPNVTIPGQGIHNVVYVVTQADSVYAIDADNGAQLWYASMLNGGTTATGTNLPCEYGGFHQEGIISTPVIDPNNNTIYLVAKSVLNGLVRHDIHALDITTGNERPGSPVQIVAQSTSNKGHVTTFNSLHQKNRPGLLLSNGTLYMGFGSNGCNDSNSGWVLSYDAASLTQLGVFNTSPDFGLTSIWQAGTGLAADVTGNLFVETAESGVPYDVPSGGQTFCNSVLKLTAGLVLDDYFTPWNVAYLNSHDFDLSSTGALILPDQDGPFIHELVASGKQGVVYVLNRDNMGMYAPNDSQIIQEFPLIPGSTVDVQFGSPAYWNNNVYFAPDAASIRAYPLSAGLLGEPIRTTGKFEGSHSPSISANGTSNGILWVLTGQLLAFDAGNLKLLYGSNQAANARDKLPPIGHFITQTVSNGKVYVATQNSLEAYGLFQSVSVTGGGAQTGTIGTALPAPIQIHAANPYNGQSDVGTTVNFSDGCTKIGAITCGSFNPTSAITDVNGNAATTYTLPLKVGTYTVTFSGIGFSNATTTATATSVTPSRMIAYGGAKQTGVAGTNLAKQIVAQAQDVFKNGVPGVTVNFRANNGGIPNPASAVTDATGLARTTLQLPTVPATVTVTASAAGLKNVTFVETSVVGTPANFTITSGNNQFAPAGTELPQALTVVVTDQFGNPVSGYSLTFSDGGAGGTFSNPNPVIAATNGSVSELYTLPATPETVTITVSATAGGGPTPAVFTETGQ
jgi:hypothetical protein